MKGENSIGQVLLRVGSHSVVIRHSTLLYALVRSAEEHRTRRASAMP